MSLGSAAARQRMMRRGRAICLVLAVCARPAHAADVGPIGLPLKIGTVRINVPARAHFDTKPQGGALVLSGFATGDLAEIQTRALAIARALPVPHDTCRHKGLNLVVESIDAVRVAAGDGKATVTLSGKVGVWVCEKLLGAKVKTRIAADHLGLTVPLTVALRGPRQLGLNLAGRPSFTTGRPEIRQAAESLLGDVDAVLASAVERLLDTSAARATLPQLNGVDLELTRAQFVQGSPTLVLRVDGTAKVTTAALASLLTLGQATSVKATSGNSPKLKR